MQLAHINDEQLEEQRPAAKKRYRELAEKAARDGGVGTLSAEERAELPGLGKIIGLSEDHDFADDVEVVRKAKWREDALAEVESQLNAEIEYQISDGKGEFTVKHAALPPAEEIKSEIDAADDLIRDLLKAPLAFKSEQLRLLELRQNLEQSAKGAREEIDRVYNGREHLVPK